jgi:hypothetical protein
MVREVEAGKISWYSEHMKNVVVELPTNYEHDIQVGQFLQMTVTEAKAFTLYGRLSQHVKEGHSVKTVYSYVTYRQSNQDSYHGIYRDNDTGYLALAYIGRGYVRSVCFFSAITIDQYNTYVSDYSIFHSTVFQTRWYPAIT